MKRGTAILGCALSPGHPRASRALDRSEAKRSISHVGLGFFDPQLIIYLRLGLRLDDRAELALE
jgi:hypothetical protein